MRWPGLTRSCRSSLCSPFRERLLADPSFFIKVAIEVGIGVCTKLTAEYTKRGESFQSQVSPRSTRWRCGAIGCGPPSLT